MCNTPKYLLHTNSLLSSQSNEGDIEQPIKQHNNARKSAGVRSGRRGPANYRPVRLALKAKGSRSEDPPLVSVQLPQNTQLGRPRPYGGRRSAAITLATPPSGLLFPRPHFRFGRLRHRPETRCGVPVRPVSRCGPR